jgi:hypothetical protein
MPKLLEQPENLKTQNMLENYTNVTPNIKGCSSKIKVFEGQFP